jgi:predicted secreted Zn-dependent protease
LLAAAASLAAAGEVHRWKDADGRVHYGDKPPAGVAAKPVAVPSAGPATKPNPEVTVEESVIRHYDVAGGTTAELSMAARRSGPVSPVSGSRVWGACTWKITWNYATGGGAGKCGLEKFSIRLSAILDLPRWTNRDAASADLRAEWDRFAAALRQHEDGHKDNGVRAANDLAGRLRALPPEKDCAALDARIRAVGERVIAEHRLADQAYDRSTGHGATQGAVLR